MHSGRTSGVINCTWRVAFGRSVNAALEATGLPARPEEELHGFIGPPLHATFAQLGARDAVQSCVDAYRARYLTCSARETTVIAAIPELLGALGPRPLLVVTPKPAALAERCSTRSGCVSGSWPSSARRWMWSTNPRGRRSGGPWNISGRLTAW